MGWDGPEIRGVWIVGVGGGGGWSRDGIFGSDPGRPCPTKPRGRGQPKWDERWRGRRRREKVRSLTNGVWERMGGRTGTRERMRGRTTTSEELEDEGTQQGRARRLEGRRAGERRRLAGLLVGEREHEASWPSAAVSWASMPPDGLPHGRAPPPRG